MSHGTLKIRIGPMFSGKTTWLRGVLIDNFHIYKYPTILITSDKDERPELADQAGSTHNPSFNKIPKGITCLKTDCLANVDVSQYQMIGIDESQFFPDLYETVKHWVDDLGKNVFVIGLCGDSNREKFGQILDLIPICDEVVKLQFTCKFCVAEMATVYHGGLLNLTGSFNKRIDKTTDQILVGGSDKYVTTCRYHHKN